MNERKSRSTDHLAETFKLMPKSICKFPKVRNFKNEKNVPAIMLFLRLSAVSTPIDEKIQNTPWF